MSSSLSAIAIKTIDGQEQTLGEYSGNVLLIVNVASYCGYTPQYEGLEGLHRTYGSQGLKVMGFPCNDFGSQEPGSNEEIKTFCSSRFGVEFPLFDKVHAKGSQQHPLYAALTTQADPAGEVAWNFEKFLISKDGQIVGRYRSSVSPSAPELVAAIEKELAR
ncbi:MAG: glutathione peroxidase [Synechococcaceae cyanobacterium RM1_1_27]|nr:glutathione peroxidase [Synechococcaceae cyanobacterium SM2_3_2]NJO86308.1 glutathione peroxidase [Synechococcaceae cyanobacterium RM1_1_27]